jgi:hypothetical protein
MPDSQRTDDAIRTILLQDWDPHNASRNESARGTYDDYLKSLQSLIESGATEDQIIQYLHEREQETMCFPSLGTERLRRVAQKLLRLRAV